jgi:predicted extracellular nuclease
MKPWKRWTSSVLVSLGLLSAVQAQVVISQVYGGGGNTGAPFTHDFIELFNRGNKPASLNGLSVQYASATGSGNFGANASQITVLPNVTLQPGQYYLIQQASQANVGAPLPTPDLVVSFNPIAMSGSAGKVALVNGTASLGCNGSASQPCSTAAQALILDLLGYGTANFFEGAALAALTNSTSAQRNDNGCVDTGNNNSDFIAAIPAPRNSSTALDPCGGSVAAQPIVPSCPALAGVPGVLNSVSLSATDADSRVNNAVLGAGAPAGFSLSGFLSALSDGDAATVQLDAAASVAAGNYSVPVRFTNDDAQEVTCTVGVSLNGSTLTPIYSIQGSGNASPLASLAAPANRVTTEGIVTHVIISQVSPRTLQGFFMQDEFGDNDASTSDGIFVFTNGAVAFNGVTAGQKVRLEGTAFEFNSLTQLTNPSGLQVLASNLSIAPTLITLPEMQEGDLERYEGMLVRIEGPLTASQNFFQGRFGQVTLSVGGRLFNPTNLARPGSAAAQALANENARRRIILDDGNSFQNPNPIPYIGTENTLRAGDTTASVTGVIDFGLVTSDTVTRDYRLHPTEPVVFQRVNLRTAAPAAVGGNLRVASFNVLNYFTTIDQAGASCFPSGTRSDCRGADSTTELTRQRDKIVRAMLALDADVLGLIEIENNGQTAVNNLVAALNAALSTAGSSASYATVGAPTNGSGTDAIRLAIIYKLNRATPVGPPISDTAPVHNRPPLAQIFAAANGERVTVIVNHFKSKSCAGATGGDQDSGDGQACFNPTRVAQAQALLQFVNSLQSTSGTDRVLIIGDLNAYAQEDPIFTLVQAGKVDLLARFQANPYSFVFNGEAGVLDHALATPSLSTRVTGAATWAINADEPSVIDYNTEFKPQDLYAASPYRSSDHDPVLVGIDLSKSIGGTAGRDVLQGTAGDDVIEGGAGADVITTGAGNDRIVYADLRDAGDQITDFAPGADQIDLRLLMASVGVAPGQAAQQGYLRLMASGNNTIVLIDIDGSAGPAAARPFLTLRNVVPGGLNLMRDFLY